MTKIILISCASKKQTQKAKAKELYISDLFQKNLNYARSISPDKIFILSAKYGLIGLEEEIEPYNLTLNTMSSEEVKRWAESVLSELQIVSNLKEDEFMFLAGERYREFLVPHIKKYKIPMQGLGIGKQLKWLTENTNLRDTSKECHKIHELFNSIPRYSFPFKDKEIPLNGIYILFEKGELSHGKERIVRIGTHTGENQLQSRLFQHFLNENKDRSIFRKNIGRAILNKDKDPFLSQWEIDLTTKDAREKHFKLIDLGKQKEIEKQVTKYIQNNFSFVFIPIKDKEKRLEFESKIISTISLCGECAASDNWLGLFSPKEKIKNGGLWQVNGLYKTPLSEKDFDELEKIIRDY